MERTAFPSAYFLAFAMSKRLRDLLDASEGCAPIELSRDEALLLLGIADGVVEHINRQD